MSYSVDLELDLLICKSEADARRAAAALNADPWMRNHMQADATRLPTPEDLDRWRLAICDFDGCGWNETAARTAWLALAPFMADNAFVEFRHEEASRFRVRWEAGRVFEELPEAGHLGHELEITPALLLE